MCLQVCESGVLQSPALYVVHSDGPDGPLRGAADDGSHPTGQVDHFTKKMHGDLYKAIINR